MNSALCESDHQPTILHWIACAGIASVAVMRCFVVLAPQVVFASDPVSDPFPVAAIGPAWSMTLDAILLAFVAVAFLGDGLAKRSISWVLVILPIVSATFVALHGSSDFDDLWRGSTWVAGAFAAIAVMHLARFPVLRAALAACMVALVAPLVIRGLSQVFYEHAIDMRYFRVNREQVLTNMGIDPNSAAAAIFEERLSHPEASGWFRLANVFGSFMVFGLVAWLGIVLDVIRNKRDAGMIGAAVLLTIASAAGLVYSGSKGAFAAAFAGVVVLSLFWILRGRLRWRWVLPTVAITLPVLAVLAVCVRGALLPEGFLSDKSILFRWHYLIGAGRVIFEQPLFGVGPGGFQDAYVQQRLPISPEEVASAHSVYIDWIAMLGVGGVALVALAVVLLYRSGKSNTPACRNPEDEQPARNNTQPTGLIFVTLVTIGGMMTALLVERHVLDEMGVALRGAGVIAYLACAAFAMRLFNRNVSGLALIGFIAGAIVFFTHAQIEVTMTHPGAIVAGWVILGVAASGLSLRNSRTGIGAACGVFVVSISLVVFFVVPAWRQQNELYQAAEPLRALGMAHVEGGAKWNEQQRIAWLRDVNTERETAAQKLVAAAETFRANPQPLAAAVQQYLAMTDAAEDEESKKRAANGAVELAKSLVERHARPRYIAMLAESYAVRARLTHDLEDWQRAIDARRTLAARDPHGLRMHLALADLLWESGQRDGAMIIYQRVLEMSDHWYLDELRQLREAERSRIEERLRSPDTDPSTP